MGNILFQLFIIVLIALGSIYILYTVLFNKNIIQVINYKKQRSYIKEFYNMILDDSNIKKVIENIVVNSSKYFCEEYVRDEKIMIDMLKKECFNEEEHEKVDDEELLYIIKIANIFYKG